MLDPPPSGLRALDSHTARPFGSLAGPGTLTQGTTNGYSQRDMSTENLPQSPEQQPPRKPRVAVVFGGRSSEHGISMVTAGAVLRAIDRTKYDVLPIGITREGRWVLTADEPERMAITERRTPDVEELAESSEGGVMLPVDPANREVVYSEPGSVPKALGEVDVVFPMLHGPYGEDGTLQGLLELSGVPYVGSGVLASAVGQDKEYMKRVFTSFGLPVGPYVVIRPREWELDESAARKKIIDFAGEHGWPLFVKPARAGSSIGITKVDDLSGLDEAIAAARVSTTRSSSWRRCCAAARSSAGSWSSRTGRGPPYRPRSRRCSRTTTTTSRRSTSTRRPASCPPR